MGSAGASGGAGIAGNTGKAGGAGSSSNAGAGGGAGGSSAAGNTGAAGTGGASGPSPALAVSVGILNACAVTADGNVWCWQGTAAPKQVPTLTGDVVTVSAGGEGIGYNVQGYFDCAVTTTGAAWCWGVDGSGVGVSGQLGNGSTTPSAVPVPVTTLTSGVQDLATGVGPGGGSACAVTSDGNVWCWGYNGYGILGNATTAGNSTSPVELAGFTGSATAVSVGMVSACALVNGAVECWGTNDNGELGNNSTMKSLAPVQVTGITGGATAVSVGWAYACAVVNGSVECWGTNGFGQSLVPAAVMGLSTGVTAVSVQTNPNGNATSACAVVNGAVECWGDNSSGQLGNNSTTSSAVPVSVSTLTSGVTAVSMGVGAACAIKTGGSVWCWGGSYGMVPVRVPGFPPGGSSNGGTGGRAGAGGSGAAGNAGAAGSGGASGPSPASVVSVGLLNTCAVTADGNAWCWTGSSSRSQVPTLTGDVASVSAGGEGIGYSGEQYLDCAVTTTGGAWCWGNNNAHGELGNGSTASSPVPTPVSTLTSSVTALSTGIGPGGNSACAVTADGNVWCWGSNGYGLLGNGTSASASVVPVQIAGFTGNVTTVSVGMVSACAIVAGGSVMCWGTGTNGELGNNSTKTSLAPVQVTGLASGATAVSVGISYACAVVNGGVQCWGSNGFGQTLVPAAVTGLSAGVTAVSVQTNPNGNAASACAVVSGGVQCWGDNSSGQLGNNSTTSSAVPVPVSTLTSGVTAVSMGVGAACAIKTGGSVWCWGGSYGMVPVRESGFPQ